MGCILYSSPEKCFHRCSKIKRNKLGTQGTSSSGRRPSRCIIPRISLGTGTLLLDSKVVKLF